MPIERRDLENKLREIEEIVDESKQQAQMTGTAIAVVAVVIVILVFLLGRRRGKKAGGARVEVYRLR
jgi:divalent metal cation (Fe/Co/Zn/Cd) transporter